MTESKKIPISLKLPQWPPKLLNSWFAATKLPQGEGRLLLASINKYGKYIFDIYRHLGYTRFDPILTLPRHEEIIKFADTYKSKTNVLWSLIDAYMRLEVNPDLYKDLLLQRDKWIPLKKVQATQEELDKLQTMTDIINKREHYSELLDQAPTNKVYMEYWNMLSWYTMIEPLRQSELCEAKIVTYEKISDELDESNKETVLLSLCTEEVPRYFCFVNGYLVINKSKTNIARAIKIPEELQDVMAHYYTKFGARYVFPNYKLPNLPGDPKHITYALNKIFGKGFSVDQIRQVYASTHQDDPNEERVEHAKAMGHSGKCHEFTYSRFTLKQMEDKDNGIKPTVHIAGEPNLKLSGGDPHSPPKLRIKLKI